MRIDSDWAECVRLIDLAEAFATDPDLGRPELMPALRNVLRQLSGYLDTTEERRSLDRLVRASTRYEQQGRTGWQAFSDAWSSVRPVWASARALAVSFHQIGSHARSSYAAPLPDRTDAAHPSGRVRHAA